MVTLYTVLHEKMASKASGPTSQCVKTNFLMLPIMMPGTWQEEGWLIAKAFVSPFEADHGHLFFRFSGQSGKCHSTVLKTLFKHFQREIKAIHDEGTNVSELWSVPVRHLRETANIMIFGVNRASLSHYFYPKSGPLRTCGGKSFHKAHSCIPQPSF